MTNITEIKQSARIADVWAALGGGKLRGNRGQAWWRGGTGYSASLNPAKGLWHDFVSGDGGDIFALVQTVHQCSFREAVEWLANLTGVAISQMTSTGTKACVDTAWRDDLERAAYWSMAAEIWAEEALEEMDPSDPQRYQPTMFLRAIQLGDCSMVEEYRRFRRDHPQIAAGMVRAGRVVDAALQRELAASWDRRYSDATT